KTPGQLQSLRRTESRARICAALISGNVVPFFLGRFVECFEKLLTELAVALSDESEDFAAQVRTAANHDRPAFGLHSLHFFGALLCGFGVDSLSRFPST